MAKLNMVQAINLGLREEMERDHSIIVLGEDVGKEGGVFRVTEGLQERFGTERVVDTPLAESGIVGVAFGLAVKGMKPVTEIQFMGFLPPALDQIISHVSRIRTRSRGQYTCSMVIRMPYGGGIHAPEHHSESNEAMLAHIPGIKVVIPSTPHDAKGLIVAAIRDPDPVVFLEPKRVYRAVREEVPEGEYTIPIGEAEIIREGEDVTLVSWGAMVREALRAADMAEQEKFSVEVIDLKSVSPLDERAIVDSVRKTGRAVVVHEAPRTCGMGAEIITRINEKAILSMEAPIERITGFDTVFPLYKLEEHYLPSPDRILRGIRKVLTF